MEIKQPKNMRIGTYDGYLELKWNPKFGNITSERFLKAQEFVDSECIRLMKPYTPFRNGFLQESVTVGTIIGSGELRYFHPGARYLYYGEVYGPNIPIFEQGHLIGFWSPPRKYPTGRDLQYDTSKHPLAGKMWFERMKADHKKDILQGACRRAGGRPE